MKRIREVSCLETKQHFNKRMIQRVRRILKETEQYKTELLHALCEQNGFVIQGNNTRLVNVNFMLNRVETEDIPFTFMYSADKTYVFGDLLVRDMSSNGCYYYTVSLKPPVFDLKEWDSHYEPLESFLKAIELESNK